MRVDRFDYSLPPELIAQEPPRERDGARLLVVGDGAPVDRAIVDLPELLPRPCLFVVNDTRVVPARLFAAREGTGGRVEILLVRKIADEDPPRYEAMVRASKKVRLGARFFVGEAGIACEVTREHDAHATVGLVFACSGAELDALMEEEGHVPLPPYIARPDRAEDRRRYQTVFAQRAGAVAAPTAGLHFSDALVEALRARGHRFAAVTLHVGLGTFRPVVTDDFDQHDMHAETFEVGADVARAIDEARDRGEDVVAVGTTVIRALESARDPARPGHVVARSGETRLLLQPGDVISVADSLLTNFHLPRSTLLALVSAFGGMERIRAAYAHAVVARYRFFSYGDAMLIRNVRDRPG